MLFLFARCLLSSTFFRFFNINIKLPRIDFAKGDKKQTNYHRAMLNDLVKGIIPSSWRRYTVPRGCTVIQWITDFSERIKQLQQVSQLVSRGAQQIKVPKCLVFLSLSFISLNDDYQAVAFTDFPRLAWRITQP